jgi:hypothetical protein
MDANKSECEKCIRIAKVAAFDEDYDKAIKFLDKSIKLYPTEFAKSKNRKKLLKNKNKLLNKLTCFKFLDLLEEYKEKLKNKSRRNSNTSENKENDNSSTSSSSSNKSSKKDNSTPNQNDYSPDQADAVRKYAFFPIKLNHPISILFKRIFFSLESKTVGIFMKY